MHDSPVIATARRDIYRELVRPDGFGLFGARWLSTLQIEPGTKTSQCPRPRSTSNILSCNRGLADLVLTIAT